jgi:hypothetical protein
MKKKTTIVWLSRDRGHSTEIQAYRDEPYFDTTIDTFGGVGFLEYFSDLYTREFTNINLEINDLFKCELTQTTTGFTFKVVERWEYS